MRDDSIALAPYGGLAFADDGLSHLNPGSRYEFGSGIEFELAGTRNIKTAGETDHKISFDGKLKW